MSDLFKKLNTLVKASLNDLLGEQGDASRPRRVSPEKLGSNIDREVVLLRQRVNEALAYEDELQARLQTVEDEVSRLDQAADDAVAAGDEAKARYLIDQMKRAQQRSAITEADLREHRAVTQELMQRVNMLDAAVADARHAEDTKEQAGTPSEQTSVQTGPVLSDVLRDAREKIAQMGDLIAARSDVQASSPSVETAPPEESDSIDDDLDNRRQRLSKR